MDSVDSLLAQTRQCMDDMNFQEVEKTLALGKATTKGLPKDLPCQELLVATLSRNDLPVPQ